MHSLRDRIKMSDADITRRFERLGYNVTIDQVAFTTEGVEDFYNARDTDWTGVGKIRIYEPPGLLVIEGAQPRAGQPTRDIAVVSLGYARERTTQKSEWSWGSAKPLSKNT